MARGRARRTTDYGEFWPGFVDVLSTLLLVVTFLMSIFMVAQHFASQEASGKETALQKSCSDDVEAAVKAYEAMSPQNIEAIFDCLYATLPVAYLDQLEECKETNA